MLSLALSLFPYVAYAIAIAAGVASFLSLGAATVELVKSWPAMRRALLTLEL